MNKVQGRRMGLGDEVKYPDLLALLDTEARDPNQQRKYAIRHKATGRFFKSSQGSRYSQETRKAGSDYYLSDLPDISTSQGCGIRLRRFKHPEDWEVVEIRFTVIRYKQA
jgi:hypothetical protein